jgi:hypothetical protein
MFFLLLIQGQIYETFGPTITASLPGQDGDASNMHSEEPADEEIEFSDDEAEAAYRRMSKRK